MPQLENSCLSWKTVEVKNTDAQSDDHDAPNLLPRNILLSSVHLLGFFSIFDHIRTEQFVLCVSDHRSIFLTCHHPPPSPSDTRGFQVCAVVTNSCIVYLLIVCCMCGGLKSFVNPFLLEESCVSAPVCSCR